jgi:ABC-type nitrate/sulfonate/bicarbonate transport system ATPase subunit
MKAISRAPAGEPGLVSRPGADGAGAAAEISLRGVSHRFGELEVLDRLALEVAEREVVALVGPSGCGKSTLLELVAGLLQPSAGTIAVEGTEEPRERLQRCALMPQRDLLFGWLPAIDNAALAIRNRGASRDDARSEAATLFERFGLGGFELTRPSELSGGMRQRVAFLRTLLARKPVLLLDEPFASLDAITRAEMQAWLAGALRAEPRTVLMVTHDVEEALYLADRVAVLSARPARIIDTLAHSRPRGPRTETVTGGEFTDLREQAMRSLLEGAR